MKKIGKKAEEGLKWQIENERKARRGRKGNQGTLVSRDKEE